jgi:hypothetical protein
MVLFEAAEARLRSQIGKSICRRPIISEYTRCGIDEDQLPLRAATARTGKFAPARAHAHQRRCSTLNRSFLSYTQSQSYWRASPSVGLRGEKPRAAISVAISCISWTLDAHAQPVSLPSAPSTQPRR